MSKNQRLHVELALIQICNIDAEKKNLSVSQSKPEEITVAPNGLQASTERKNSSSMAAIPVAKEVKISPFNIPSFSIKDALKGETVKSPVTLLKEQDTVAQESNSKYGTMEVRPFTQEELDHAWEKHALLYKNNQPRMYSTLNVQLPVLKENYHIELALNNLLQEEEVLKIKTSLQNFLQNELKNIKIILLTSLVQADDANKKFYTDKEKFDHLAQKNPGLINFKQQFGLDFG